MSYINPAQQADTGSVVCNDYGECYLFGVNRNIFKDSDASTVFRHYFKTLFETDTFYIIAGTDSGLLYQYVKTQGIPKGSRYLFVELPNILACLTNFDSEQKELVITSAEGWGQEALQLDMMEYAVQDRVVMLRSLGVIHGHYSDYPTFLQKVREEFDVFRQSQQTALNTRPFTIRQIENLAENRIPAICLKNAFQDKTAVLLAGGPSLDDLLPWVKEHRDDLLVIAVSRISYSLIHADIQPDIVVSVDPYAINMNVSKEMLQFGNGTLLVGEYHLNPHLLSSWAGPKAFIGKRYPWSTSLEPKNLPSSPGNTVTNSAFALAVETGVAQLVLGGTDFCFSDEGYTHASGSAEHSLGPRPMFGDKRVETYSGKKADSNNTFINSAQTVDSQAEEATSCGCLTINPAPGAMRLPHIEHLPLDVIEIEPMAKPAREIIKACLKTDNRTIQKQLYADELGEVDRILGQLGNIKKLAVQALVLNKKLFDDREKSSGIHNKTKLERLEKQLDEKFTETVTFIKKFGLHHFIPVLKNNGEDKKSLEENSKLYFQAFNTTATELINHLQQARSRILNREEEAKTQPDVNKLLEQWKKDNQPGRAIQWTKHHVDYVCQLPAEEQKSLQGFSDSFDETVEELNKEYMEGIEEGLSLNGLAGKARDYYLCKDKQGLLNLATSLDAHTDQAEVSHFRGLVQGYTAELDNNSDAAINAYRSITEGPAFIDALMRRYSIHTSLEDIDSSLDVLKSLSCCNASFTPMYAELLQATGDIDTSVEIYTDYLLANPDDLNTMMKLGKLYQQHGATDGVEWSMNYILGKDPDNQAARAMLDSVAPSQASGK